MHCSNSNKKKNKETKKKKKNKNNIIYVGINKHLNGKDKIIRIIFIILITKKTKVKPVVLTTILV